MKFKKPTQKAMMSSAKNTGLIIGGIAASRGVKAVLPESLTKYAQAIMMGAGILLASSTESEDLKLLGNGLAAIQGTDLISSLAKEHLPDSAKSNPFLKNALGMNGVEGDNPFIKNPIITNWEPTSKRERTIELKETSEFVFA